MGSGGRAAFLLCVVLAYSAYSFDLKLRPDLQENQEYKYDTDNWAIQIEEGMDPQLIAEKHGHELIGSVGNLKGIYLFKKKPDTVLGVSHPHHDETKEIIWHQQQVARVHSKRSVSDPSYYKQWHLHSDGSGNVHINVEAAWANNITGAGVVVGVVDDGLEYTHPDMSPNYKADLSYDFNYGDSNPYPDSSYDDHGTSAAGVAAAAPNTVCGVGSAYHAGLAGLRLISRATTDAQEASALGYKYHDISIYSNSWGPIDDGKRLEGPGYLAQQTLKNGAEEGRNGKGSIFVWAAGNGKRSGDNCNYDGWANSIYTISVGAVDNQGVQSWYSENCAMLLVTAPSSGNTKSITTTDLNGARGSSSTDCTSSFGGTSSAAPLVAGVVALILEANPSLGWRDVQGVFVESSSKNNPTDSDWFKNGGNHWVNHKYGFGLVNAALAVETAQNWEILPEVTSVSETLGESLSIPDGTSFLRTSIQIESNFVVEHVEVHLEVDHRRRGDLFISITSPFGTESVLAEKHSDTGSGISWTFGSVRHWGENPVGTWTLKISDQQSGIAGTLNRWTLNIYGH